MKYYCNPINVNHRYQFNATGKEGEAQIHREAADPFLICYKGIYYMFASKTLSVWSSTDLVHWESHRLPDYLPLYDYAPDVRVLGEYVYFCASKTIENCDRFRTKDVINGPYERIPGTFSFYNPNLFVDDDGRVYFYWGCDCMTPISGLRVFGSTEGTLPKKAAYTARRLGDLDFIVKVKNAEESGAEGFNIVWEIHQNSCTIVA